MPDFQQLAVLALALAPGFVAIEIQSFVALRRRPPALETTLHAIAYSALLYWLTTLGQWGPQYDPAFATLMAGGGFFTALTSQALLLRYLFLLAGGIALGLATGHSLSTGFVRSILAALTGRNVIASTWQEFFHDRPGAGLWAELPDKRRIVGQVTNASDTDDENIVVLAWPQILAADGRRVPMGLTALLLDTSECTLVGVLPDEALPRRIPSLRNRLRSSVVQAPRRLAGFLAIGGARRDQT